MRLIFFALLGWGCFLSSKGETIKGWLDAAPTADVAFASWNGDLPQTSPNVAAAHQLAQGFYGYLDLSRLPAEDYPLKLRLLYDAIETSDVNPGAPGTLSRPNNDAPLGIGLVVEETVVSTPNDAHAIPVWTEPASIQDRRYGNVQENVRAEILGKGGQVVARLEIAASTLSAQRPRALLINAPTARTSFVRGGYQNITEATKLVPDSFALTDVGAVWIDSATANDPALGDNFWRAVLLGGTKVMGLSGDIAVLSRRLGLSPNQPILLGGLVASDSPEASVDGPGPLQQLYGTRVNVEGNPFSFPANLGEMMHHELLTFSIWYLVTFVILQALVIAGAFYFLRGPERVWIWLVIPCFALVYAVLGVALSHGVVRARSDSQLTQVELMREGWPQALLFTHLQQVNLQEHDTVLNLAGGSRPFVEEDRSGSALSNPSALFSHDTARTYLNLHCTSTAQTAARAWSVVDATSPCSITGDGKLDPARDFSGAWFWSGSEWRNLGPLGAHHLVDWKVAPVIHPPGWSMPTGFILMGDDSSFPNMLIPLLSGSASSAMTRAGDALFLGAEHLSDQSLPSGRNDRVATRHVIAYQFHLAGGTP